MHLQHADVVRELDAFVALGRKEYLKRTGNPDGWADSYFILWKSFRCDMKAVSFGVAGKNLGASQQIAKELKSLGFIVVDADGDPRE